VRIRDRLLTVGTALLVAVLTQQPAGWATPASMPRRAAR